MLLCQSRMFLNPSLIGAYFMKTALRLASFGLLFLLPAFSHAQGIGGCVDSPECPTAVLGLVGAAGAALYVRFRSR